MKKRSIAVATAVITVALMVAGGSRVANAANTKLTVKVLNTLSQPIQGIAAQIADSNDGAILQKEVTDASGVVNFFVPQTPASVKLIVAQDSDTWEVYTSKYEFGVGQETYITALNLKSKVPLYFTSFNVSVLDINHVGIAGASVVAYLPENKNVTGTTGSEGKATLSLPYSPTGFTVVAKAPGYLPDKYPFTGPLGEKPYDYAVVLQKEVVVDPKANDVGFMKLLVTNALTKYPIPNAKVTVIIDAGQEVDLITNEKGETDVIRVRPGSTVIFNVFADGFYPLKNKLPAGAGQFTFTAALFPTATDVKPCIDDFYYLKRGDRGTDVSELQKRLRATGIYRDDVTGFYGSRTETAVQQAQSVLAPCYKPDVKPPLTPTPLPSPNPNTETAKTLISQISQLVAQVQKLLQVLQTML